MLKKKVRKPGPAELLHILNRATFDELTSVHRIDTMTADLIVTNRPYTSEIDILERGIVGKRVFQQLERQLGKSGNPAA